MFKTLFIVGLFLISVSQETFSTINLQFFTLPQNLDSTKFSNQIRSNRIQAPLFDSQSTKTVSFKDKNEFYAFIDKQCPPSEPPSSIKIRTLTQASSTSFSKTNNLKAGVDEGDHFKTDGEYIYTVSGLVLSIVKAYPSNQTRVVWTFKFIWPVSQLIIQGNYLAVFGERQLNDKSFVWMRVYNIAVKNKPILLKEYKIAGRFRTVRKAQNTGVVYLISSMDCQWILPWYDFGKGKIYVPFNQIFYFPKISYKQKGAIQNILAFDLENPLNGQEKIVSIMTKTNIIVYMSEKSIYITWSQSNLIGKRSFIQKVSYKKTLMTPVLNAILPGNITMEQMIDENDETLNLITVDNTKGAKNIFFALDSSLKVVSSLQFLEGITITTARFWNTGVLVGSSNSPIQVGAASYGYLQYIHIYDEVTLIAVEKTSPRIHKIYVLNTTDFSASSASAIAEYSVNLANSTTLLQLQHKAFMFSKEKNLLVTPFMSTQKDLAYPKTKIRYSGAFIFELKKDTKKASIDLKAVVSHKLTENDDNQLTLVRRSLYIGNILYTKSQCLMKIVDLDKLKAVANLELGCQEDINESKNEAAQPNYNPPTPSPISLLKPTPVI